MIRVVFVLRAPEIGGAERQLIELVRGLDAQRFQITVLPFYPGGALRRDLEDISGVTVRDLGKTSRWDIVSFLRRLRQEVRAARAGVVYGCLSVANEAALLVGRLEGARVIWRLGAAYMDLSMYDWTARPLFALGKHLSRFPDRIVINSHAGLEYHRSRGYDVSRMQVIPNGFDTDRFTRRLEAGAAVRRELGIETGEIVVGMAARLDPIKNHPLFLDAAARVAQRHPRVRFVCVGGGPLELRDKLAQTARERGLGDRILWTGSRNDMPAMYSAFDVHCLCSYGEGLPNAVGESMACEVPNVVTDVGDAARLIGDTGQAVPSDDREALARAIEAAILAPPDERRARGTRARQRIVSEYRTSLLASRTGDLMLELTRDNHRAHPARGERPTT
jgi:glycosyltransferase involved in cell wall biosynthesis